MELIGNGKSYRVPPYQRDYSWSEEQWEDLWNDIQDLSAGSENTHYLGALVVESKSDRDFLIIDGQQRLATLSVLSLAIIQRLDSLAKEGVEADENEQRCKELRNRFIGEKDPASLLEKSRLRLNETDDPFYQDYLIQLRPPINPRGLVSSNHLLWKCCKYFQDRIGEFASKNEEGRAIASLLSETVARQLLFILIVVDDELNAYTVFETLNARGVELTTTDLLKNYLFSLVKVSTDLDALKRRWNSLVHTVGQKRFPEFLRYHLLCTHSKVRSKNLFKVVRDETRSPQDVFKLLGDLEGRAELFSAVLDSNHGYWIDISDAKPYVRELNLFRVRQPMPLLFAAWDCFSQQDFVRVLKLVSIISFRYSIVSRLNTNELEPVYHRAAKAVATGISTTLQTVFEELKPIYVKDEKSKEDFAQLEIDTRGPRKKLVKYILAKLESKASKNHCDHETDPGTIEHIFPENPTDEWVDNFPEDISLAGTYRIGNLTLLESSLNKEIGNYSYGSKIPAYSKSRYEITKEISEIAPENWTPGHINDRQKLLAKRAVAIWRSDFM